MATPTDSNREQIRVLTRINLQDMADNLGVENLHLRGVLDRLFWPAAEILARQVATFDRRVSEAGLGEAARELLRQHVGSVTVSGAENIPSRGGVLIACNHPGMADTLTCFANIPRPDLRIVSADRPFLRALPNIVPRLFFVSDAPGVRLTVVREVARFLRGGGAVLLNPAGRIEPDPATMRGAVEALQSWSESLGLFVRLAPDLVVVPAVVSGVVYEPALHSPLTRLRKTQADRERVAATLQAFLQSAGWIRRSLKVKIEFGAPRRAADLIPLGDSAAITRAITNAVRQMLLQLPGGPEASPVGSPHPLSEEVFP